MPNQAEARERVAMVQRTADPAPLMTSKELANRLGITESTVEWWRSQKQGPKFIRLGRGKRAPIRYEEQAVGEYLREMKAATERH